MHQLVKNKMKKTQLRNIIKESIKELMTEQTNHDQVLADAGCYCPPGHGIYQAGGSACGFSCNNLSDPLLVAALNSNGGNGDGCYYQLTIKLCVPQVFPNGNPVFANDCCVTYTPGGFGANGIGSAFNNACDGSGGFNYGFYGVSYIPGGLPQNSPGTCESECTGPNCSPPPPPPTPLVAGCTVVQSLNYDATADGCPDANGVVDVNDISCCVIQPGGGVTPTNVGPTMASNDTKFATPTPNPNDPQVKRMKDLAFKGKR